MRRIALMNEKGGVAKSTTTLNLAATLATEFQKSVLVIDLDHQANLSQSLSGDSDLSPTLTQVLLGECDPADAVYATKYDNLELLPCDAGLADVAVSLGDSSGSLGVGREFRLRQVIDKISEPFDYDPFDYILIDTSPSRSLLTINALMTVSEVIVPIDPSQWSIMGVRSLEQLTTQVSTFMKHHTRISCVVLTKTNQTVVCRDVEKMVRDYFGDKVAKATIPASIKVEEANARGLAVRDYAPDCRAAHAYLEFTQEVMNEEEGVAGQCLAEENTGTTTEGNAEAA